MTITTQQKTINDRMSNMQDLAYLFNMFVSDEDTNDIKQKLDKINDSINENRKLNQQDISLLAKLKYNIQEQEQEQEQEQIQQEQSKNKNLERFDNRMVQAVLPDNLEVSIKRNREVITTNDSFLNKKFSWLTDAVGSFEHTFEISNRNKETNFFGKVLNYLFSIRGALTEPKSLFWVQLLEPLNKFWNTWFFKEKSDSEKQVDRLDSIKDILIQSYGLQAKDFQSNDKITQLIGKTLSLPITMVNASNKLFDFFSKKDKKDDEEQEDQTTLLSNIRDLLFDVLQFNEDERKRLLRSNVKDKKEDDDYGWLKSLFVVGAGAIVGYINEFLLAWKSFFKFFKSITSIFGKIVAVFTDISKITEPLSKGWNWIKSSFSKITGIFSKIGSFFSKIGGFFSKLGAISKISAFIKPALAFTKAIPIVGWVITGITAVFDFFKGFFTTEGDFFDKLIGGFKGLFDGIGEVMTKLPLNILEWITNKVAGIFDIKMPEGWSDKTYEFIKNLGHDILDWLVAPFKSLYNMIFGEEKKKEPPKEELTIIENFKKFFSGFWDNITKWLTDNPVAKGISYLWEKVTGEPLFSNVEKSSEPVKQPTEQILPVSKDDKASNMLSAIDTTRINNKEEKEKKKEEEFSLLKSLSDGIENMSDTISSGLNSAVNSTTAAMQNVYNSAVNMVSSGSDDKPKQIPEGIEALGLMLKNNTWGF